MIPQEAHVVVIGGGVLGTSAALHLAAAYVGGHRLITADRQLARNADALNVPYDLIGP